MTKPPRPLQFKFGRRSLRLSAPAAMLRRLKCIQPQMSAPDTPQTEEELLEIVDHPRFEEALAKCGLSVNFHADYKNQREVTPLHVAAMHGNRKSTLRLLGRGAELEATSRRGDTPLAMATKWGKRDIVELLFKSGAHIDSRDHEGLSPLHHAAMIGLRPIVRFLLQKGADANAKDKEGHTPIHRTSDPAVLRLLVQFAADINVRNHSGKAPLHMAADNGARVVVAFLLAHKAEVNTRDEGGYTPLHYAVQSGKRAVLGALLSRGAIVNAAGRDDRCTPLHFAVMKGDLQAVQTLMSHGADPRLANTEGLTAIDIAAKKMLFDIYPLLLSEEHRVATLRSSGGKRGALTDSDNSSKRIRVSDENQPVENQFV